jgi:hypothetical protein
MPKGTRVSRCVDKVKKSKDEGAAIAICQSSTNQGYATGKALKEALATKFGSMGSKLSKTSSRHATNPGESKAEARDDAKRFTKKHGQQASQTHKQTGKIPGPKPGLQTEAAPLVAAAARLIGPALLRRAGVAAGRGAAQGTARRVGARAARKAARNPKAIGAMGTAAESGYEELKAQRASNKDLEETKMNNAYINKLEAMGLVEGHTTGDDAEATGERVGRAVVKGADPTKALRIGMKVASRKGSDHTRERGKEFVGGMGKASRAAKRRRIVKIQSHTEYHQIGFVMAEAMGLIKVKKDTGADEITKAAGDPEAHERRHTNIPKGSTLAKRTPLTKKKPGESTGEAIRRRAEEEGKAGKNPRG